jgi:hypothetical protein
MNEQTARAATTLRCRRSGNEEAFQNARKNTPEAFKKIGFNPAEIMKNLNVEIERAVYRRSSY